MRCNVLNRLLHILHLNDWFRLSSSIAIFSFCSCYNLNRSMWSYMARYLTVPLIAFHRPLRLLRLAAREGLPSAQNVCAIRSPYPEKRVVEEVQSGWIPWSLFCFASPFSFRLQSQPWDFGDSELVWAHRDDVLDGEVFYLTGFPSEVSHPMPLSGSPSFTTLCLCTSRKVAHRLTRLLLSGGATRRRLLDRCVTKILLGPAADAK